LTTIIRLASDMANVEITAVDFAGPWSPGAMQSVDVAIDNKETVGPAGWGPVACSSDGLVNDGHMTDVTLRIEDAATGVAAYEETKGECIPVERPSTAFGPNATVHFSPSLPAGEYVVRAELQVRGDNGTDRSDSHPLTVEAGGATQPPDGEDGRGGLLPGVGDGSDGIDLSDPLGSAADNPAIAAVGVILMLILLSSYADLAASVVD
jgi:hypothetical protein